MPTFEYRKLFRADVILRVEYETLKDKRKGVSYSRNLSSTGINIVTGLSLNKDDKLDLVIYIPELEEPIRAKGKVIWQSEISFIGDEENKYYSTGVQFVNMTSEDAIRESDYVRDFMTRKNEEQIKEIINKLKESENS